MVEVVNKFIIKTLAMAKFTRHLQSETQTYTTLNYNFP